jgi:outer membrane protein OmpA-like peptidoglycan-associated protein
MMNINSRVPVALLLTAAFTMPAWSTASAQELDPVEVAEPVAEETAVAEQVDDQITVYGSLPSDLSGLADGPDVEGFISARRGREIQITGEDGTRTTVVVADATEIRARGGFLGLDRASLTADALLNGLPVEAETVRWEDGLIASRIRFRNRDLETAAMIRGATEQQFAEQGAAIDENTAGIGENTVAIGENTALANALRGRMGDIDQYNIKGVTNVYFDTGKWDLSPQGQRDLCAAAEQADAESNALLLVVGYTDSTGDQDYNQVLSERRAGRVVNYLQQQCSWAPYRMLTPTGMAESDPLADNSTAEGRAQNRRVSVNILVSKALDGL